MTKAIASNARLRTVALGSLAALLVAAWLVASPVARADRAAGGVAIRVAKSRLGQIVADGRGRALYLFEKDPKGKSACYGSCAKFWPPLLVKGKPSVGAGTKASLVGVLVRKDGTRQVTYAGHPLYGFVKDEAPGQIAGQGLDFFGGGWYVLSPAGVKIEKATTSSSSSSSSGYSGYGR